MVNNDTLSMHKNAENARAALCRFKRICYNVVGALPRAVELSSMRETSVAVVPARDVLDGCE
eukprot:5283943-Pleurochrysis_carterae.AAC.7